MDQIKLVIPTGEYLDQAWAYRQEFLEIQNSLDGCGTLKRVDTPEQWLAENRACADPATLPDGKVQATQFLAVRESDGKLVGMIQVRHYFNEYLEKYAGNIGYSVRPCERRRGYAREMLRLALPFCKEIGLDKVLITCKPDNEGSRRTILSQGGVYESTVHEPNEGIDLERYWIAL